MPSPTRPTASSAPRKSRKVESGTSPPLSPKPPEASATPPRSTRTGLQPVPPARCALFFSLAIVGCTIDLLTKHWIFQWRGAPRPDNQWWLWHGYVGIETALNTGALFGKGAGYGGLFAALSLLAAAGILYWLFYRGAARDRMLTIALGCVTGGILGNLYDRLGLYRPLHGPPNAVRDWILLRYGEHTWPNFNVADSLLVSGAILLMWHAITHREPHESPATPSQSA